MYISLFLCAAIYQMLWHTTVELHALYRYRYVLERALLVTVITLRNVNTMFADASNLVLESEMYGTSDDPAVPVRVADRQEREPVDLNMQPVEPPPQELEYPENRWNPTPTPSF